MSNRPTSRSTRPSAASARITAAQSPNRTPWFIGGAVALVVVLSLVVAIILTSSSDQSPATTPEAQATGITVVPKGNVEFGKVQSTGSALPDQPDGAPDPALGLAVPSLSGQQFDGSAIEIPAAGTPKVVMFLAHWCPHCQKEVPLIADHLSTTGLPDGVDLFAVATSTSSDASNYPPSDWLAKEGWPIPTLVDDESFSAATAYGIGGFPFFVAVGADGKVVARTSGELTVAQFTALIDTARSGARAAS